MQPNLTSIQETTALIKKSADLREIAKPYLYTRKQKGKDYLVSSDCPCGIKSKKNDKDIHCQINKDIVYCHACDKTFDVFSFIQTKENCSFVEAKEKIATLVNIKIDFDRLNQGGKQIFLSKEFEQTCVNNQNNNFSEFCITKLGIKEEHLKAWKVGTYGHGNTIFLQKDLEGKVWNYQVIPYSKEGKKTAGVFSAKQPDLKKGELKPNFYLPYLYGSHLLRESINIPIIVVESPKSAVIASWFYPQYDWVACMSANGLTERFANILHSTQKPIYWLCDSDGNEKDEQDRLLHGGRLNSSIENLARVCRKSYVIDLFPQYLYANKHILNKYHWDIADEIIDVTLNHKGSDLIDIFSGKTYSTQYYVDNIFANAKEKDKDKFWVEIHKGKGTYVSINMVKYLEFLANKGFCYININGKNDTLRVLLHIDNNVAKYADSKTVQDFVIDYINNELPFELWKSEIEGKEDVMITKLDFLESMLTKPAVYFGEALIKGLPIRKVNFLKDTKEISYKPFRNGVAVIQKDITKIKVIPYVDLKGVVWKHEIINRDFEQVGETAFKSFNFYKFLWYTQSSEKIDHHKKRMNNLLKTIGYLVHSYKHQPTTRLVFGVDESINDDEKGGTGKGIAFHKAIKHFTSTAYQDGKTWDFKNEKIFGFLQYGEKVACISDIVEGFDIESLYNAITDDMTVKLLYKDLITIEFENSPKFVFTGNFPLKQNSMNADKRRTHIVEFSPYFSKERSVESVFKQSFFQEWNSQEWNLFDNVMCYCLQKWLNDFDFDVIEGNYETKVFHANVESEEVYTLNSIFKPIEGANGGDWLYGELIKKNDILELLFPEKTRKKSKLHYYKELKNILQVYFKFHEKEISLKYTKGKYPYFSDGYADYIVVIPAEAKEE